MPNKVTESAIQGYLTKYRSDPEIKNLVKGGYNAGRIHDMVNTAKKFEVLNAERIELIRLEIPLTGEKPTITPEQSERLKILQAIIGVYINIKHPRDFTKVEKDLRELKKLRLDRPR